MTILKKLINDEFNSKDLWVFMSKFILRFFTNNYEVFYTFGYERKLYIFVYRAFIKL